MGITIASLIGLLFGIVATLIFESFIKANKKLKNKYYRRHNILFGYHAHHSVYGLVLSALGIILDLTNDRPISYFLIAAGIGVILVHTISERRFVFIEKK